MQIVKEGNLEKAKKTKLFVCESCGCEFKADKGEYEINYKFTVNDDVFSKIFPYTTMAISGTTAVYTCKCPCCNSTVTFQEEIQNDEP